MQRLLHRAVPPRRTHEQLPRAQRWNSLRRGGPPSAAVEVRCVRWTAGVARAMEVARRSLPLLPSRGGAAAEKREGREGGSSP
jgi:hypothetical protein